MKVVLLLLFILCLRNVSCQRRIVGGSSARDGWFPYAAYVLSSGSVCTGSLLTPSWVLTAAHCVYRRKSPVVRVMAGAAAKNSRAGQWRHSWEVKVHPSYIGGVVGGSDIALVKVSVPFNMRSRNIGVIPLSNQWWPPNKSVRCIAMGWGRTSNYYRTTPNLIQYQYTWVSQNARECPCLNRNVRSKVLCLRPVRGAGPCSGDSGGPLVCGGKAVGVAHASYYKHMCNPYAPRARNFGCATAHMVMTYIFITPQLNWIRKYVPGVPAPSTYFSDASNYHCHIGLILLTVLILLCK